MNIFSQEKIKEILLIILISKCDFIRTFGNPNPNKNNRYSWSGSCVPTYNNWNSNGQILTINKDNDILRNIKINFPLSLLYGNLQKWNNNKKGFFICKKIGNTYEKICFGKTFNYDYFIECMKNKKIIFDSGMYDGNNRNYSNFWNELIIEEF